MSQFVAANAFPDAEAGSEAIQAMDVAVLSGPYYASVEEVLRRHRHMFDLVYIHRVSNCSKYMALVRHYVPKARIVYSVADLHHLRLERQAAVERRPELMELSRRVRFTEFVAARLADIVLTHSTKEAELLQAAVPGVNVHVLALVRANKSKNTANSPSAPGWRSLVDMNMRRTWMRRAGS